VLKSCKGNAAKTTMKYKNGFTIVELLIVIVVIGILAALVLNTFAGAQEKARLASASSGVNALIKGIKKLEVDTGRSGFGCPAEGRVYNPEGPVSSNVSGIMVVPPAGSVPSGGPCIWETSNIAGWNGPYLNSAKDPWGGDYTIDNDYNVCENGTARVIRAALSTGPNKQINYPSNVSSGACTVVTSDDIYKLIN
jgi:prepilin-type N-terminal cleavage/methylation domain-containing protein